MLYAATIREARGQLEYARMSPGKIALVPTMGNLHRGHLSLVKHAKQTAKYVVVSIFVNPTQFVEGEDFDDYPRTPDVDLRLLEELDTDLVFIPTPAEIYPKLDIEAEVVVPALDSIYCGKFRPGHFKGVATVVLKLFNITKPDIALFGKKDYQQLLIIRALVRSLDLPIEIIGLATVREADGLAISSRNHYLSEEERKCAPMLYQCLMKAAETIKSGERNYKKLADQSMTVLKKAGFQSEYFSICDAETLKSPINRKLVIIAAAWLGKTRLIDNITVDVYD